jgi:sterol desaturase/sphingolipid hydroxylase (fatty acid hydroxylase superfamily)
VIATPEFHHGHHSADPATRDRNFAGELPVIDWLFGTLHLGEPHRTIDRWPTRHSLDEAPPSGYLRQLARPFRVGRDARPRESTEPRTPAL